MLRRIHRPRWFPLAVVTFTAVDAWCDTASPRSDSGARDADHVFHGERAAVPSNGGTLRLQGRRRLWASNAMAGVLDVLEWSDGLKPTLRKRVEFGRDALIEDVVVSPHGLAVVVLRGKREMNGRIVVLDNDGQPRRSISLPRVPERLLLSEDGRTIVAVHSTSDAAGREPTCHFSLVDWANGGGESDVVTVELTRNPSLRGHVFSSANDGPTALTSEDMLATADGARVAVVFPSHGVRVIVESERLVVDAVQPLGGAPASRFSATHYEVRQLPPIGTTVAGQVVRLGGFSGLYYAGKTPNGKLRFITHTDRGPNGEMMERGRPFLLPRFNPRLVWLELDPQTSRIQIVEQLPLTHADGSPLLGIPNVYGTANAASQTDEVPVNLLGGVIPREPLGGDFEGLTVADDGSFWLADEYRPSLYHFDRQGRLLQRMVPIGSHAAARLTPPAPGETGPLGVEVLPSVLAHRRQNRGFEAITFHSGKVYAMVQSPLRHPATLSDEEMGRTRNVRLIELDPVRLTTRQFLYVMDNRETRSGEDSPADKIGDMATVPGGGFLVIERDDDSRPADPASTIHKRVYSFTIDSATEISSKDQMYSGRSLEQLSVGELLKLGIKPIEKQLHVDLVAAGYDRVQKVEGLTWIDEDTIAVLNDNDFGVGRISIDGNTGKFTLVPDYKPEPVILGVISRTSAAEVAKQPK